MEVLLAFQSIRSPILDIIAKIFTLLGEQYFIMVVFCALAWCGDKRFAHKTGFAFCMGMGINQVMKLIFCVQRPWVVDKRVIPSEYALESATGYSFPSGHTQSGITFFGCIARYVKDKFYSNLCIFFAIMIGLSRIYFGVHTFQDVLMSFVIGVLVLLVTDFVYDFCEKHDFYVCVGIVLVSILMVLFAIFKPYPPYHVMELSYDCIKIAGAIGGFAVGWFLERRFIKLDTKDKPGNNILKLIFGIGLLLAIKFGMESVLKENYFTMYIQHFILIFWCICIFPFIIKKTKSWK